MINENARYNFYLTETENEDDEYLDDDENEVLDPFGIYAPPTDEDEETDDEDEDETESTGYKIIEDDEDIDLSDKVI